MIRELLILHHSHTDIGYTHPQPVVWKLHDRYLDEAMDLCESTADDPEECRMKWTCEVSSTFLHWLERASPAQQRRLEALVARGQIAFGAMWGHWTAMVPEDVLLESLAPIAMIRERFGAPVGVAIQHDVNGAPWPLADMLLDHGVEHLVFGINLHSGGYPLTRPLVFRWRAPSGREVTVFSGEHYNTFSREAGLREPSTDNMAAGLDGYFAKLRAKGWNRDFAFLTATHPFMDDNNPPNPELPDLIRRWNDEGRMPRLRMVTPEQLFERVALEDPASIPAHGGDWTDYWTFGIGASALDTALSRRAHSAWWTGRALATALPPAQHDEPVAEATLHHLMAAAEHTWNAFSTGAAFGPSREFEPVSEAEQRVQKSRYCAGALSLARMWRRDLLDKLAGNPPQCRNRGLLIVNPADTERTVCLRVPNEVYHDQTPLIGGTKHRLDVMEAMHHDGSSTLLGPFTLPPFAVIRRPMAELHPAVPAGCAAETDGIASPFWQLRFDPATGDIRSLRHAGSGHECFDPAAGWDFFGAIRETVAERSAESIAAQDPRYDIYQITEATFAPLHDDVCHWNRKWPARHERAGNPLRHETRVDAEGAHFIRVLAMPGVHGELRQTITLLAHEPRIRCEAYFNKAEMMDPEALYFAFPFALANAAAHFDTAGQAVAYHDDQLPGACRDFVTAGSWIATAGDEGCLAVACPDAPLFQIGGFHFGRGVRDAAGLDQALLLAWPANNYWVTNFRPSQPGYLALRYEITRFDRYDPAACARFAAGAARPPLFHPLGTAARGDAVLLACPPAATTVSYLKPCPSGVTVAGLRDHATRRCIPTPIPTPAL
ncbi:MAG: hypothetical protein J0M04_19765 [Verrucomicrobia bacterium]|nr:hypothetical protein [Verrucomicrobiota bacterium]